MSLTISDIKNQGLTDSILSMKGVTDATAAAAQAIYCGFVPRYAIVMNLTDGIRSEYFVDNTAGTSVSTAANGTVTVAAANGFTPLTDTHATAAKATGSPQSSGPGILIGTGPLIASKTFNILLFR